MQIEKFMNSIKGFKGWFMRDTIPKHYLQGSMMINTDVKSGSGIHWVCIYDSPESPIEYFDPFGLVPPPEVDAYMQLANKEMLYNNSQLQNIRSELCGWYCMYYIMERSNGRSSYDVMMDFSTKPSDKNEELVDKFGQRIIHGGGIGDFLSRFNLNGFIDSLPFEAHIIDQDDNGKIRRANFVGPGTKFRDRVELDNYGNITKVKTKPINKLDAAAMEHDRVYEIYHDIHNRNIGDYDLLEKAREVALDNNASKIQRANAVMVGLIMKTKIKYGI